MDLNMPRLQGKREEAAQLMAKGETQAETSRIVGTSKQTMNSWAHDEEFQRRISELRADPLETADELLIEDAMQAVNTVKAVMRGEIEDPRLATTMLKAALYVLDLAKRKKLPAPDVRDGPISPGIREKAAGLTDDELDELLARKR